MHKGKFSLYNAQQIRICEQKAAESGVSEDELMLSAGTAAFKCIKHFFPQAKSIAVFCGSGNNAGDGFVLARLAYEQGYTVAVYSTKAIEDLPPAARHAAIATVAIGVPFKPLEEILDSEVDLIVDSLLGIGAQGAMREPMANIINMINDSELPILSLDIPSGLDPDTGRILGSCIKATVTLTFFGAKCGMFTMDGPDSCGEIIVDDLNQANFLHQTPPVAHILNRTLLKQTLKPRLKNSHKGMYGHVLIIGGGPGMPGAVCLAAHAALRVGAGLVTIATLPEHAGKTCSQLPEALIFGIENKNDLYPLLNKATVCIVGPGLGEDNWAKELFLASLSSQLPLVIDASALHLLAQHPQKDDNWVLTPHPGEAGVLLGCETKDIQADRINASESIQHTYGGCIVLKGAGTIINTSKELFICTAGNPGMATAGMGDVLSGVIGGLIAQGLSIGEATKLGVLLHAEAGDAAAATDGERGLIAGDLMPFIRKKVNLM